ncbi:DUF5677 domain-containing protein [Candidatus Palauibacter sp.]|uniref:DUF5677 domain-containing protein n=1 Tax=Candidatus Palauibacter sp. TaxID=3101350 RepID=UPI003B52C8B9
MSTTPFRGLLDRNEAIARCSDVLENACSLLRKIIDYSTGAYARCMRATRDFTGPPDAIAAPFALFHYSIATTDGIDALLSNSCVTPAIPLVRSSYETSVALTYMTRNDFEQRSLSWLCGEAHLHLRWLYIVRDNDVSNEFSAALTDDMRSRVEQEIQRLEGVLARPHMADIELEYQAQRNQQNRNYPHWYSLFGGARDLRTLTDRIGERDYYDLAYRRWSGTAHASTGVDNTFAFTQGVQTIQPLRHPREIIAVTQYSAKFLLRSMGSMITKCRPAELESLSNWHNSEVQPDLVAIARTKLVFDEEVRRDW